MDKKTARESGYREGYGIVMVNRVEFRDMDKDDVMSAVGEIEENGRQYSPFEFFAAEINRSRNPEDLWEAYEDGVFKGANAAYKKIRE